jgi:hypothetical protein
MGEQPGGISRLIAAARAGPKSSFARSPRMANQGEHLTGQEARAGSTPHTVRYILLASLVLVVIAFAVLFTR